MKTTTVKQYTALPTGFKQVKRGDVKHGDIVKYRNGRMEQCVGLAGFKIKNMEHWSKIYRKTAPRARQPVIKK
jgi:hypothetical protein